MATLNEGKHTAEFLLSEGNGYISREQVTVAAAAGDHRQAGRRLRIGKVEPGARARRRVEARDRERQ